jgi:lysyl-tRNA synthetase, class I
MEAPVLRWLYARRRPNQSFKVAFDAELTRLYDEWDATARRVAAAGGGGPDGTSYFRAMRTSLGPLPDTPRRVSFRTLASIVDVTTGSKEQLQRILTDLDPAEPITDLAETEPRLGCATRWIEMQPADQRTQVRDEPDTALLAQLSAQEREAVAMLVDGLDTHRSLEELTALVYGVPKVQAGLPPDAKPTPELKVLQRGFFSLLYRLLVGRDTGPRLPTLLLAIGPEHVRALLRP